MNASYTTERLQLRELNTADAHFILELLNTQGWIKFIGDRNITTTGDAENYISKILSNPAVDYRVVTLQQAETAIGLVTLIKRDYLEHHDIGFAFLPAYNKQGYAFEASKIVLDDLLSLKEHATILATTIPENSSSIQLLEKLGLSFNKQITHDDLTLDLYAVTK